MKIAVVVGHSRLKNGCYTSADGTRYGGCNEYKWCKAFSKEVANALKKNGHTVKRVVCPEKKFTSSIQEKTYKLNLLNQGGYDLVMELHLNSSMPSAEGTEVLYKSEEGKKQAKKIQKKLATVFRDRGIKERDDLYMLNGTKATALILETFFCTNKKEYKKAKGEKNRKKIAKLVADGIGKSG